MRPNQHIRDRLASGLVQRPPYFRTEDIRRRIKLGRALPDRVAVRSDLEWSTHPGLPVPDAMWVERDLRVYGGSALSALPATLYIGGSLHLIGCRALRAVPADLFVERDLVVKDCPVLQPLPRAIFVGEMLRLDDVTYQAGYLELSAEVPDTILNALPGRRLSEFFDHRLLADHRGAHWIITEVSSAPPSGRRTTPCIILQTRPPGDDLVC